MEYQKSRTDKVEWDEFKWNATGPKSFDQ